MTTAVLLGAGGMLATELAALSPPEVQLTPLGIADLDITSRDAVAAALDRAKPDVVVNASAYTAVDRAETEYEIALAVNGTAVGVLGELCAARGIRVVHFSTDYVFDGNAVQPYRESDPVNPVNAYGRSKLAGERGLAESGADALVLRTQWLFGIGGQSFPRTMWGRAQRRLPTRVVADQIGRLTSATDLARATWELVGRKARGLYHVANGGDATSWFDVARVVFDASGASACLQPCTTADYPTAARRPAYSVLSTERIAREHSIALRPWPVALTAFLELLQRERPG